MSYVLPIKLDKGSGAPLVLLHGLGNNYKSWSFVLEHIDYTKWRVIALDLLGFGDAPKPSVAYTPEDHANAVMATLDSLGIEKAVFAGHSMGCIVAIEIASRWPNRVERLALFGAPVYKAKPRRSLLQRFFRAERGYFSLFEVVKKNPEAVQAGGKVADELVPFIKGMEITEEVWPAYKKSLENTLMQFATYKKATTLRVPTLFVNGIFDFFIIRGNIRELRRANEQFVKVKQVLGPHELTPRQGRTVARILDRLADR